MIKIKISVMLIKDDVLKAQHNREMPIKENGHTLDRLDEDWFDACAYKIARRSISDALPIFQKEMNEIYPEATWEKEETIIDHETRQ